MQDYYFLFLDRGPSAKSDDLALVYPATAADWVDYKLLWLSVLSPSVKEPPGEVSRVSLRLARQRRADERRGDGQGAASRARLCAHWQRTGSLGFV